MRSLRRRNTTPSLRCCTFWKGPECGKVEEVIAATTEQLEKLIPSKESKTLKIKTAVRIGKPYQQIIQLALESRST